MTSITGPIDISRLFEQVPLSKPLRARLRSTAQQLERNPQASLPEALGEAGYKGLMRMLSNPRVQELEQDFLLPVYHATVERMPPGQDVLSLEDTTDLIFGGERGRKALPRLEGKATGFRAHIALAVRADVTHAVLGVLDLQQIVRESESKAAQSSSQRYKDPNKESLRWRRAVEATERRAAERASLIHVRDREADDYEDMATMVLAKQRFIQRMREPRALAFAPADAPCARRVDEAFEELTGLCEREVHLSPRAQSKFDPRPKGAKQRQPARRSRLARLRFTARAVCIRRPDHCSKSLPITLTLHLVRVEEIDPPAGEQPVEWWIWTTEPIGTVEQVLRVVDHYRARWLIEEFNKGLQTGCEYEKLQMESAERLWLMLAFYCPIVTNMLVLRTLAHHDAETPAEQVLSADELHVLSAQASQSSPSAPMTVKVALALIARIGGHFKHNGAPGWLVLLRGMATLHDRVQGWRLAQQQFAFTPSRTKTVPS